ncbi:transmembrane amino acid transporter protein-domain-containing protein [Lipomyces starkeyi]
MSTQRSPAVELTYPRRGSLTRSLRFAGGVNSLDRFASSYSRAQSFLVLDAPLALSAQPGVLFTGNQSQRGQDSIPLLHHALSDESAIAADDDDDGGDEGDGVYQAPDYYNYDDDATETSTVLPSLTDSDGATARSALPQSASAHIPLPPPRHNTRAKDADPLIGGGQRVVVDQSKGRVLVVPGRSTAPQTVFNSVNILIGIGLLSLPLAFSYAGWLIGTLFIIVAAAITLYTAKVLTRCLDTDPTLVTYADIAYAAFGARARLLTSVLFSMELLGSCVALVVLFADSINTLLPDLLSKNALKIIAFFLLTPLSFLPLSVLSFTSILGIISTFGVVLIVFIDGLLKTTQPGSLWHPMPSSILPTNWKAVPLSLGLLMAPWCGHSVFPNVYRDMRHPYKFKRCLNISYIFTFLIDASMGILGLLMFGNKYVTEEITNTVLDTPGYPRTLSIAIIVLIAFIPLSKTPLNARPIITTIEVLLGVSDTPTPLLSADNDNDDDEDLVADLDHQSYDWPRRRYNKYLTFLRSPAVARAAIRILTNLLVVIIAILFPAFDRIMALVGSALGFTICIVLPLAFYLKIFGPGRLKPAYYISPSGQSHTGITQELSKAEIVFDLFAIAVGAVLAVVGGVWALLPDEFIFNDVNPDLGR